MSEPLVKIEHKGKVSVLTLNDPQKLNAMSDLMSVQFSEIIDDIKNDPKTKVLVVTGAERAFSAGGNLDKILGNVGVDPAKSKMESFAFYRSFLKIYDLTIPTIAAVNGAAVGAGGCLAMACDMRFASDTARMGFTFIKIGLNPGMGAEYLLTRAIGASRTYELLMTGDIISAEEALNRGLVNRLYPREELLPSVMTIAENISKMPALPLKAIKEAVRASETSTMDDILHKQAAYQAICYQGDDVAEGIQAIKEKRPPRFED